VTQGIVALRQPSGAVYCAITLVAIALAGFVAARMPLPPRMHAASLAVRVAVVALMLYGVVAFALGMRSRIDYPVLLHGASLWQRLPNWLQGAFVGSLILLPVSLALHLGTAWKVRGLQWRIWSLQTVVMSAGFAIAAAGLHASPELLSASSGPRAASHSSSRAGPPRLQPELDLAVNGVQHLKVLPGTPLIFTLLVRNGDAERAAFARQAHEHGKQELDHMVSSGAISREEADRALASEPPLPPAVPDMTVTITASAFSFATDSQGSLPWQPVLAVPAAPASALLDGTRTVTALFVVAPEKTASTAASNFKVHAQLDNQVPGQWQGRAESNRVTIEVEPPVATPSDAERRNQQIDLAWYYLVDRDFEHALAAEQATLDLDSGSVDALTLRGNTLELKGDYRGALDAYLQALKQFETRHPAADLLPAGLDESLMRVRARIDQTNPAPAGAPHS